VNDQQSRQQNERMAAAMFELQQDIFLDTTDVVEKEKHRFDDVVKLLFTNISKELDHLSLSLNREDHAELSQRISFWFEGLNHASYIPLSTHIKVLHQIEPYLKLLSDEMHGQVMRTFKLGVLHIRDKARENPALFPELVRIIADTLDLAVRGLTRDLARHMTPLTMEIQQTFELGRLGLVVAKTLNQDEENRDVSRLKRILIMHELWRRLDVFALTDRQFLVVNKRLQDFVSQADIIFVHAGEEPPEFDKAPFLLSR